MARALRSVPSSRVEHICSTPGCTRSINNKKRSLCGPCASSYYYFKKKSSTNKKAITQRKQQLSFWSNRLSWLFEETKGGL